MVPLPDSLCGSCSLVIGPPGCGKTLTAESIAEAAARPLFTINVTDVGLDAGQAEENLQRVFQLSANWNAILLL
jgi:AAA+ superfamily predicted ATPase